MNLSDFFLPSSLEPRLDCFEQQKQQGLSVVRMPPRSAAKDVISASEDAAEATMDHLRTHNVNTHMERVHSREKDRPREVLPRPSDITFYVGRTRSPFTVSAHTLKHSTYFASLLEKQRIPDPVVLDCDEATFLNLVLILRYGSFEALPKMSDSELFRLKMELECYGIDVPSSPSSSSSSQRPTPKPRANGDFPDLPEELKDPSKLFLVARMDDIEKGIRCECTGKDSHTYWALSFHHRHTFCTACGRCPSSFSPRHLAEMYMAAAMYYSENFDHKQRWSVGCDSTCSLKLLNAKPGCVCPCVGSEESDSCKYPTWAVSTYYSHAFCTRCGQAADERTLIFILLTHRYGGAAKHSKHRRDHAAVISEGALAAQESRNFSNSSGGSEIVRHHRGNRSM